MNVRKMIAVLTLALALFFTVGASAQTKDTKKAPAKTPAPAKTADAKPAAKKSSGKKHKKSSHKKSSGKKSSTKKAAPAADTKAPAKTPAPAKKKS